MNKVLVGLSCSLSMLLTACGDDKLPDEIIVDVEVATDGPSFDLLSTPVGTVNFPNSCNAAASPLIERGVALAQGGQLEVKELPSTLIEHSVHVVREEAGRLPTLVERETDYIRHVLDRSGQNRTRAAKILGIDRVSLWRKLKKYGLEDESQVNDN